MDSQATLNALSSVSVIGLGVVNPALYGISFTLYCFCVQLLYHQLQKGFGGQRSNIITLVYMSMVMAIGLAIIIIDVRKIKIAYIEHADYPGGPFHYDSSVAELSPAGLARNILGTILECSLLGIQVWRLWVVWSASRYIIGIVIVPTLFALTYIGVHNYVFAAYWLQLFGSIEHFAYSSIPTQEALILTTELLVTVLILSRIVVVGKRSAAIMGQSEHSRQYTSVISMLIESFALDFVWTTVVIIFSALNLRIFNSTPLELGLLSMENPEHFIRILAYMLVIYRVVTKRGWDKDTERRLTSLQWNHSEAHTVTEVTTMERSIPAVA